MKRKNTLNVSYGLYTVAAWSLVSLLFALASGRISRKGPDIFATTDPVGFRNRLIIYGVIATLALVVGSLLLLWQLLRPNDE